MSLRFLLFFALTLFLSQGGWCKFTGDYFRMSGVVASFDRDFVEIRNVKKGTLAWAPRQDVIGEIKIGSSVKVFMTMEELMKYHSKLALLNHNSDRKPSTYEENK